MRFRLIAPTLGLLVWPAYQAFAQQTQPAQPAPTDAPVPDLMFFTLGAVLIIAIGAFVMFLRKRSNREATDRALNPNHPANK
jgi:hypothetical protein